jgi:PAS domain-containing protein
LWWRRKGLVVAVFLAAFLIFSHVFVREAVVTANDYFRALMFIAIAFVVATLSERIAKAQENGPMNEITLEVNQRRRDGTHLPVEITGSLFTREITGSLFTRGGQRLAMAIARDITERKWAEAGGKNHEA